MTDPTETLNLGDGIKLTPVNPTAAAIYGVLRTLVACSGIIVAAWNVISTRKLAAIYAFFTAPTNQAALASLAVALGGAACLAWGAWKKYRGKTTENTLKAAVVTSAATGTPVATPNPAILPAQGDQP